MGLRGGGDVDIYAALRQQSRSKPRGKGMEKEGTVVPPGPTREEGEGERG